MLLQSGHLLLKRPLQLSRGSLKLMELREIVHRSRPTTIATINFEIKLNIKILI